MPKFIILITARKRSLGQGNILTPVCHSVHGGGSIWAGIPPSRSGTPPGPGAHPQDQVHTPRTRYTPWDQVHPLGPGTPPGPGTPVCHSVHRGSTWAGTPPSDQVHPQDQVQPPGPGTTPLGPGTPPQDQVHHRTRYTPWDQVHPLDQVHTPGTRYTPQQCMLRDTGNKRAVRILLECILMLIISSDKKDQKQSGFRSFVLDQPLLV